MVAKASHEKEEKQEHLAPDIEQIIDFRAIKTGGQIFGESFVIFRQNWRPIVGVSFVTTILYCGMVFGFTDRTPDSLFNFPYEFMGTISQVNEFFINKKIAFLPFTNILLLGGFLCYVFRIVLKVFDPERTRSSFFIQWLKALPGAALLIMLLWTNEWYTVFLIIFGGAFPLIWIFTVLAEEKTSFSGIGRSINLVFGAYGKALGTMTILMMIGFLFFSLLDTVLFSLYFDMVGWLTNMEGEQLDALSTILQVGTSMFMLCLILSIIAIGMGLLYFLLLEIKEAPGLLEKIGKLGQDTRIRGLERE